MRLLCALLIVLLFAAPLLAAGSTIVLNEPNPVYGSPVTFTIVYPKEAARKVGRRQMFNPDVDLRCYQNGVPVYATVTGPNTTWQNGDGTMTSITDGPGARVLGGVTSLGGVQYVWASGAADCYATLYYFSADKTTGGLLYNFLAAMSFHVNE